ncbi:MAG: hypothetical protein ACM3SW_00280, partial [Actinomycetota bacterium]
QRFNLLRVKAETDCLLVHITEYYRIIQCKLLKGFPPGFVSSANGETDSSPCSFGFEKRFPQNVRETAEMTQGKQRERRDRA